MNFLEDIFRSVNLKITSKLLRPTSWKQQSGRHRPPRKTAVQSTLTALLFLDSHTYSVVDVEHVENSSMVNVYHILRKYASYQGSAWFKF